MRNLRLLEKAKRTVIVIAVLLFFVLIGMNSLYAEIIPPDRRINWNPGIPGGIPSRTTICANVKNAPYNAIGDGVTDDTSAIQNAINACPTGEVVFIPAGTYKLTDQLNITKGIVLRGDGSDGTVLKNYKNISGDIIKIYGSTSGSAIDVTSGYLKDSISITVSSAASLSIGDYIMIYQTNDPSIVKVEGCTWCSDTISQVVRISSKNGNTLTLNRPLYYAYNASYNPRIQKLTPVVNAGIEELYLEDVDSGGDYAGTNIIHMVYTASSWVKNIESYNAVGAHIRMEQSFANEIRGSYFHHGHSTISGRGYGVFLFKRNCDNLIEDNIFYRLRHSMILESGGEGNVFAYNYSKDPYISDDPTWLTGDISTHGAHPYMNLFEGNKVAKLFADNTWGSGSQNTFFRNNITRVAQDATYGLWSVIVDKNNYYENIVGNVICELGCVGFYEATGAYVGSTKTIWRIGYNASSGDVVDLNVAATIIRHGNYDYFTNNTNWDPSISDKKLPNSYYLNSKPSFFKNKPWPLFGGDLSPVIMGKLPAEERFYAPHPPKMKQ